MEANVKDENDGLDNVDKEEEDDEDVEEDDEENEKKEDLIKEDFGDFIKEFNHVLNETDLKKIEKYFDKKSEKKIESKNVEEDEGIQDGKMVIEKVDELINDFNTPGSDCFNHCSEEKIHCLTSAANSMLRLGSTVMNRQKLKFI